MGLLELFILAVGLSMDAFAVSICGVLLYQNKLKISRNSWVMVWSIPGINAANWLSTWSKFQRVYS